MTGKERKRKEKDKREVDGKRLVVVFRD